METASQSLTSPWPHRLAVALALVTFPLIWVGGLVTTYDAGMAVPDWPGTYGYNLLLYPWQTWIGGPWDLFIEHGHRLLGMAAGMLSIALLVTIVVADRRRWLIVAATGALALVIVQGVLGGARVLFDERLVAMFHGCVGPLFFAYLAALVVATSRWWNAARHLESTTGRQLSRAAWMAAGMAYVQLLLGASVRHVPLAASPQVFRAALALHLVMALLLAAQVAWTAWQARLVRSPGGFVWPAGALCALIILQLALGVGTYVVKYSWPAWLGEYQFAAAHVVREKSLTQSLITTAHVATGSLILFVATALAMRTARVFFGLARWNDAVLFVWLAGGTPATLGRAA
jgi:cytochrome c oxidase assembly protein subunit 15